MTAATPDTGALLGRIAELERQLATARGAAPALEPGAALEQRQDEFLSMLAHELRNPLAPISMATNMLGKLPDASAEVRKLQAIIERQVLHMSRVLDELLDTARMNGGVITVERKPLGLVELIGRAVESVQVRLLDRGQRLACDMPVEMTVEGDPQRLAQLFSSLIIATSTAAPAGATIRVAAGARGATAFVTVENTTPGLTPEARLEDRGDGLGVVRNIVQLHGGSVTHARDGGVSVTLPLYRAPPAAAVAPPAAPGTARRILLIEDNRDANDTLRMLLAAEGHAVTSAFDGITGLGLARSQPFDVLICDIGLPGMTGLELIGQLRRSLGLHIPFAIAVSGYGQSEDRERAIGAGFGHYLVKPVDVAALLALVRSDAVSRFIAAVQRR